jgi:hypothetical protein
MEGEDASHSRWAPQPLSGSNNRVPRRGHFADARAELSVRKHSATMDVLSGQVPFGIVGMAPVLPQIRAGKLKALAVLNKARVRWLPDVPAVAESPVMSEFEMLHWMGVQVQAQTSPDIIRRGAISSGFSAARLLRGRSPPKRRRPRKFRGSAFSLDLFTIIIAVAKVLGFESLQIIRTSP